MAPEFAIDLFLNAGLDTKLQDTLFELVRNAGQPPGRIDNGHAGVPQPLARYDLHMIRIIL